MRVRIRQLVGPDHANRDLFPAQIELLQIQLKQPRNIPEPHLDLIDLPLIVLADKLMRYREL